MKFSRNKKIIVITLFIAVSFGIANFVLALNTREEYTAKFNAVWAREYPGDPLPAQATIDREYEKYVVQYGPSAADAATEQAIQNSLTPEERASADAAATERAIQGSLTSQEKAAAAAAPSTQTAPKSGAGAPAVQPVAQTSDEVAHQVGAIAYIIGNIFGRILALIAWFVDYAIKLGDKVIDMPIVRLGWQIVLNFTNLGFVLAIIVIAFATIFRLESYALKQTLWKLVVAVLLVNFSLVIAGAFISVSNSTTNIFLQATTGDNLSNALANTVNPQRFSLTIPGGSASFWSDPVGWATNKLTKAVAIAAGLIFSIIFTFLAILVFFALFLMLLIRAIALIFLLILSPFAWLCWIFPYTQQYWKKWWTEFLRWNFFAPIVLFFVYLTVATAAGLDKMTSGMGASASDAAKAFEKSTMVSEGFVGHAAQLFIILGMLFGGLYVANSFGIAGGGLALKAAQGTGKWLGGWAGRKATLAGTLPFRYKWGEKGQEKSITDRMLGWGTKKPKNLLLRGISAPARFASRYIGAGLSRVAATGGESMVADAKKRLAGYDLKRVAMMMDTLDGPGQAAALQMLADDKSGDLFPEGKKYISRDMKNKFNQLNIALPIFSNIERAFGFDIAMREIGDEIDALAAKLVAQGKSHDEIENDPKIKDLKQKLREAGKPFAQGFRPAHASRTQVDELFKPILPPTHPDYDPTKNKPEFGFGYYGQQAIAEADEYAFLETNPDVLAGFYRNMKGRQFAPFHKGVLKQIEELAIEAAKTEKRYEGKPGLWLKEQRGGLFALYTSSGMRTIGVTLPESWRKQAEGEKGKEGGGGPTFAGYESHRFD